MGYNRRFLSVDAERILDYVEGECSIDDIFCKQEYIPKTSNSHDKGVYYKEYEDYMREWGDDNYE